MAIRLTLGALLVLVSVPLAATGELAPRLPVEAFFQAPVFDSPAFSPDGSRTAAILHGDDAELIATTDAAGALRPIVRFPDSDYKLEWVEWANAKRLLFGVSFKYPSAVGVRARATRLYAVDPDGSNLRHLGKDWPRQEYIQFQDRIVSMLPEDPGHVLVELRMDGVLSVYRVKTSNGRLKRVVKGRPSIDSWLADQDGVVKVGFGSRRGKLKVIVRASEGEDWHEVFDEPVGQTVSRLPLGFDFDGRTAFVASNHASDRMKIYRYDLAERRFGEVVFEHEVVDVGTGMMTSRKRRRVLAFGYLLDDHTWHFVDEQARAEWAALEKALPGRSVDVVSATADENWLILEASGDTTAPVYYFYDRSKLSALELYSAFPKLTPEVLAPMESVSYEARDGRTIRGYLTLPVGSEARALPTVVLPHGGPTARDYRRFNREVQFLANRGYAVFQMNFRGSTGYGREHMMAGMKQWGLAMQDDITDGVQWLVGRGIADPKRICIFGSSYGGYAALMGLVKTPELFRCAASYVGVTDLATVIRDDAQYVDMDLPLFPDDTDKALRERVSPLQRVDEIRAPVLLAHGEDDPRVHVKHAKKMAKALEKRGKPHELHLYRDEIHGFADDMHSIAFYEALEDFLARNLVPPASPTVAAGGPSGPAPAP